jgi:hypothetical protein
VVFIVLLAGSLPLVISWRRSHNEIAGPPLLKANGKDLKATVISPSVDAAMEPGKNVLWCSTFQLVWNEGCRFAGGDIHLSDEPPVVAALNKKLGTEKDVDADSCLVMSGMVEDGIVKKIRQELGRKFEGQADPDLFNSIEASLPADGWVGYAYLFRALPFKCKFNRLFEPLEFGSAKVASFGILRLGHIRDNLRMAEQVTILDYKSDDDFVLALQPKDESERIVLAKIMPAKTLQETIEAVRSRIKGNWVDPHKANSPEQWKRLREQSLEVEESLIVPVLNFELLQSYDQLVGKKIIARGRLEGMPIAIAMQDIRFRLDENGAILKSEGVAAASADHKEPKKPRQFIFDKPFLILLERKDAAQPYFALWVDNPELLAPYK